MWKNSPEIFILFLQNCLEVSLGHFSSGNEFPYLLKNSFTPRKYFLFIDQ